jgi:hypothetical protein
MWQFSERLQTAPVEMLQWVPKAAESDIIELPLHHQAPTFSNSGFAIILNPTTLGRT